jgi:hypothetical protein
MFAPGVVGITMLVFETATIGRGVIGNGVFGTAMFGLGTSPGITGITGNGFGSTAVVGTSPGVSHIDQSILSGCVHCGQQNSTCKPAMDCIMFKFEP